MYKYLSDYVNDDTIRDLMFKMDYLTLINFVDTDEQYLKFVRSDKFWREYKDKYSVEECIENNYYILLYYKTKFENIDIFNYSIFNDTNVESLKVMLTYTNPNSITNNNSVIVWACKNGYFQVVKLLLKDSTINASYNRGDAFIEACGGGYTDIVKLMLEDREIIQDGEIIKIPGVDPSVASYYPILSASEEGHTEVVKLLLADERTLIQDYVIRTAANEGRVDVLELLLEDKRITKYMKPERAEELMERAIQREYFYQIMPRD